MEHEVIMKIIFFSKDKINFTIGDNISIDGEIENDKRTNYVIAYKAKIINQEK